MCTKYIKEDIRMNHTNNSIFSKSFLKTLFIKQNQHHRYGVLGHTLKVTYSVLKQRDYRFVLAALLHDIGKPFVAYQKDEDIEFNEYSFTDHEDKSYQIIKNWRFVSQWTKDIVRYHYIIRDIRKCKEKNDYKRLNRLENNWATFNSEFISELEQFLVYDDLGK